MILVVLGVDEIAKRALLPMKSRQAMASEGRMGPSTAMTPSSVTTIPTVG